MMRKSLILLLLMPSAALAHDGTHFHPHGIEPVWMILLGVAALVAGIVLGRMRR